MRRPPLLHTVSVLVLGPLFSALPGCSDEARPTAGTPASTDADSGSGANEEPYPPPAPDDCITDVTPGHQALECDGLRFDLEVPARCETERCGFIVDVHGFGMNSTLEDLHTGFRRIAGDQGYIVLQPSAPGEVPASSWTVDEDAKVFALMQRVLSVWHVDPKRIHFDGYSQGALMTWRFICAHSDIIASAAPIAGGLIPDQSCTFTGADVPAREMPILATHGHTDGLAPFSLGASTRDAVLAAWYPGVEKKIVAEAADYEWARYENATGTRFEFVQHDWECAFTLGMTALGGHCFPGSKEFLGCGQANPFVWSESVLQFFIDHPMK